LAADRTS